MRMNINVDREYAPRKSVEMLRIFRRVLGINQAKCAKAYGISTNEYGQRELGHEGMYLDGYKKVMRFLREKCREMYGAPGLPDTPANRVKFLIGKYDLTHQEIGAVTGLPAGRILFIKLGKYIPSDTLMKHIELCVNEYMRDVRGVKRR